MAEILELHPALLAGFTGIVFILATIIVSDLQRAWGEESPLTEAERLTMYDLIRLRLALMAVIAIAAWSLSGQPLSQMGLQWGSGWRFMAAWGVVALVLMAMTLQMVMGLRTPEQQQKLAKQLDGDDGIDVMRPSTRRELSSFQWVGLTAGITEEIIFRGFLTVLFAMIAPLWLAIILANALFVFAHIYQGWKGMLRILPITAGMAFVAWLGDSLYPAIVLHVCVDWLAAFMFRVLAKTPDRDNGNNQQAPA